jgi:hypothetical protein
MICLASSWQAWLGHKNIQHTVRYTELAPDQFKASGADAASARTPRLWPYEHQPGMDRGEHSVVHFQVRFVSLTFVALFIALSVIVSKD